MPQQPRQLDPDASPLALFGAELRASRSRLGLSQASLGRLVHVSGDLLAKIEKAERRPQADLVGRLDHALRTGGRLAQLAPDIDGNVLTAQMLMSLDLPPGRPTPIQLLTVVAETRRADHSQESDGQVAVLLRHVRAAELALRESSGVVQRELAAALGEAHQLVGWISFDRGDVGGAERWLTAARAYGEQGGDTELVAFIAGPTHGFVTTSSGDPTHGLERSYGALSWARRSGNRRLTAFVLAVAARAHAKLGEAKLCMAMLDDAERELDRHNPDRPDAEWLSVFDEAGLAGHRGSCLLDLGLPSLAIEPLTRQDTVAPELFVRNRVIWLLDRAKAYLRIEDVEAGCSTVNQALDLTGTGCSRRVLRRFHAVGLVLQAWEGSARVDDVLKRVRGLDGAHA